MTRLAYFSRKAVFGDRRVLAAEFLQEASEEETLMLLDAATMTDDYVKDFERRRIAVMIRNEFGEFWFAGLGVVTPPPQVVPSGLVALARGVVELLQN